MFPPPTAFLAPADSARVVSDLYTVSLAATVPIVAAAMAFLCLRQSNAGMRSIVWRCVMAGLLAIVAGRLVPWQWMAWILPELLTRPLVTLGTVQLDVPPGAAVPGQPAPDMSGILAALVIVYWSGVALVLLRTLVARTRLVLVRRAATPLDSPAWRMRLQRAGDSIGAPAHRVRLLSSPRVSVPVTWGVWRPVVVLPQQALGWPSNRVQAVLRHEMAHVRAYDAAMRVAARVTRALFWFHPGVWWLTARFEADAEEAADDRVLLSGIRASDYAEWLGASLPGAGDQAQGALAFVRPGNLRGRLATVTNIHRRLAVPGRRAALGVVTLAMAGVLPLATVQLAPTRQVLTSLMQETRWESRAWAVVRLAQRADSVDVARTAARHDPDPAVRAWARYALGLRQVNSPALPRS
ncbi:MAG TPA: M56 family metallopeptidase [Gemmatimonadaceae bacterium]